jgi:hypothetical protein
MAALTWRQEMGKYQEYAKLRNQVKNSVKKGQNVNGERYS